MSILAKILDRESPDTAVVSDRPPLADRANAEPCMVCDGVVQWLSVYRDGVARCLACEPPPSNSLVAAKLVLGEPWPRDAWDDEQPPESAAAPPFDPWDERSLVYHGYALVDFRGWPTVMQLHPVRRAEQQRYALANGYWLTE